MRGATSALAFYAANGLQPTFVFDFEQEYYRTGGTETTFDSAITHSRSGNATMVDSDGLLKWAPHNLLTYSEQFDNVAWAKQQVTVSANAAVAPDGTVTADRITSTSGAGIRITGQTFSLPAVNHTISIWVKAAAAGNRKFRLVANQAPGSGVGTASTVFEATDDWQRFNFTATGGSGYWGVTQATSPDFNHDLLIWGAHLYRSDLGGMVSNPDQPAGFETYVPTTSAARYLPRRGHHVYNGSEWVNEGLLVESESRTQLLHTTDALVTQSHIVTAVPHTLHFTGTGTVTLSGASTAGPLVGTGDGEESRVNLTFTPSAGTLTLTVSGTVTNAQLETGSTPSSYIPNLAASGSVTRAAETLTIPAANLPWPTPNVIGPELVTNGTFDTDLTGWTIEPDVTANRDTSIFTNGGVKLTNTASVSANTQVTQVVSGLEVGKLYMFSADAYTPSSNTVTEMATLSIVASGYTKAVAVSTTQVDVVENIKIFIFAASTSQTVYLSIVPTSYAFFGSIGAIGYFDNISVREIDPLAMSIQMQGRATGDTYTTTRWYLDANNYITQEINTSDFTFEQAASGTVDAVTGGSFTSGVNTAFNIASRHGSTFINGAVDGTSLAADTTPTALPDLSSTDLNLAFKYMGTIRTFRMWADDLGDTGIAEASS